MRIRTFHAPDMQVAMQMVRDAMGDHAIILSTARDPQGRGIQLTAGIELEEPPINPQQLWENPVDVDAGFVPAKPAVLGDVEGMLRFHNVPEYLVYKIMETAQFVALPVVHNHKDLRFALSRVLDATYAFAPIDLIKPDYRIMLVGPPGIGKTLTIAKMAAQIVMEKQRAVVITTDNKRAGGVEQLAAFTGILGIELQVAGTRGDLWRILQDAPKGARVLIDSAGANPYDFEEMKELSDFVQADDIEPVLVAAAGGDSNEAEEIARAFSLLGTRRLIVSRADTARRFGNILTTAGVGDLSLANVSSTPRVVGEFKRIDSNALVDLLTYYQHDA